MSKRDGGCTAVQEREVLEAPCQKRPFGFDDAVVERDAASRGHTGKCEREAKG
jgi:hypothetical protein